MYKDKIIELCIFHIDNKDKTIEELKAELDKVKKGNINTIMDVGLDNERLQAEVNEEKEFALEMSIKNDKLKAENNDLKIELELLQGGDEQGLILSNQLRDVEIKELKAENKRLNRVNAELSDKLQAVNDDYNNDTKVHNDYADGLLVEIKELKAELETSKQLAKDLSVGGGMPMNDNI